MPGKRLSMRKIREVLRLKYELNRSNREIGFTSSREQLWPGLMIICKVVLVKRF